MCVQASAFTRDGQCWPKEAQRRSTLTTPWPALPAGGYFFGTVPDGKRVLAALNRQQELRRPMLTLTAQTFCEDGACERARRHPQEQCAAHKAAKPQVFGSAYTCAIADSVTEGVLRKQVFHSESLAVHLSDDARHGFELERAAANRSPCLRPYVCTCIQVMTAALGPSNTWCTRMCSGALGRRLGCSQCSTTRTSSWRRCLSQCATCTRLPASNLITTRSVPVCAAALRWPSCTDADGGYRLLQADAPKLLKHFLPHFEGADPSLEQASALFTAFCFRKPEAEPTSEGDDQQSVPESSDPHVSGLSLFHF